MLHRLLGAAVAALMIVMLVAATAQADPRHDFAGSHAPRSAKQRSEAKSAGGYARSLTGPIGPDVSSYQGCAIDWTSVATARPFAFAKASEGSTWTDPCFAGNWPQMRAAGILRGAYDFARPRWPLSSARAEARHYVAVVKAAGGFAHSLPPVLDVEVSGGLGPAALRGWIRRWITEVRRLTHRYRVTIYTGAWFWNPKVGSWAPRGAMLWASGYTDSLPPVAGFRRADWWQYTDGAYGPAPHTTRGLGAVDHSLWLGSTARLRRLGR